ncbi:hypothetical protein A9K97_gp353 [Tokyovirus A1]|uniref:hypothetical protein n=1 Tax=Tokyovirus A1 TaxID=1826170 RepID=UPI0007A983CC|nr:hypothetical protein A9K97_gp353 [Tokyovirus A1]BAU79998.1 hypothetical protein [Tokyovirus A1]
MLLWIALVLVAVLVLWLFMRQKRETEAFTENKGQFVIPRSGTWLVSSDLETEIFVVGLSFGKKKTLIRKLEKGQTISWERGTHMKFLRLV